ncbi:MAG: peroxiredoxin-like family protein [Acidimicrobiales bacterium]
MRDRAEELAALGAEPVAVGFSPAEPLAALAEYLQWPWPFLSDTERVLYHRLGLPRAKLRQVWTPGTKDVYREAHSKGKAIHAPVEDPLQLGGDAVARAGKVTALWRPASPDDRPAVDDLMAALRPVSLPGPAAGTANGPPTG